MTHKDSRAWDPAQPPIYQVRIQGHLGSQWTDWFEGLTITLEDNGDTLLTGPVVDQAALHGLLRVEVLYPKSEHSRGHVHVRAGEFLI